MSEFSEVTITKRRDWGPQLMTITIDQTGPDFAPGQFFNLGVRINDELIRRSYSIASEPGQPAEFFLSRVSGGALTEKLFELKEGDKLLCDLTPMGFFVQREMPTVRAAWLVATGTGLGPYISMLREGSMLAQFARVVVVHGVREPYQLAYADELRQFDENFPKLTYVPVLSGTFAEDAGSTFADALKGRITTVFENGTLEARAEPFQDDSHMLLCGNPQMITDMSALMKARGYEKHRRRTPGHFNFEKYWQ